MRCDKPPLTPGYDQCTRELGHDGPCANHLIDSNLIGFDDSWAKVELWRWQYGELPKAGDSRPLDIPKALVAMAEALRKGCETGNLGLMPTPFNVCEVLKFCARQLTK